MQIQVERGDGNRHGSDIIDPLLTDNAVGTARGTQAINASIGKRVVDANCPLSEYTATGVLAQVASSKEVYRGKVTFFAQTVTIDTKNREYYPTSALKIERIL